MAILCSIYGPSINGKKTVTSRGTYKLAVGWSGLQPKPAVDWDVHYQSGNLLIKNLKLVLIINRLIIDLQQSLDGVIKALKDRIPF